MVRESLQHFKLRFGLMQVMLCFFIPGYAAESIEHAEVVSSSSLRNYLNPYESEHHARSLRSSMDSLRSLVAADEDQSDDADQKEATVHRQAPLPQGSRQSTKLKASEIVDSLPDISKPKIPNTVADLKKSEDNRALTDFETSNLKKERLPVPVKHAEENQNTSKPKPYKRLRAPVATRKSQEEEKLQQTVTRKKDQVRMSEQDENTDLYIAPVRKGTKKMNIQSMTGDVSRKWGVRVGTWAKASIKRSVSNAELTPIEIYLDEGIVGTHRVIPKGSQLFGRASFNLGVRRLNINIIRGITPDGIEFALNATAFSQEKVAGLAGKVERNRIGELREGLSRSLYNTGELLLNQASLSEDVTGLALGNLAKDTISREQELIENVSWTIHVQAQKILIRVDTSF